LTESDEAWLEGCKITAIIFICINVVSIMFTFYIGAKIIYLVRCGNNLVVLLVIFINLTLISDTIVLVYYYLSYQEKIKHDPNDDSDFNWGPLLAG
jgi:hypothetical protein